MKPLRVGRVAGAAILVHPSWLLIELLLVGTVLFVELPAQRPDWSSAVRIAVAALVGAAFLAVTVVHEAAHLVVGARLRQPARDAVLHAFGAAAPLDGGGPPPVEAAVALAGPIASGLVGGALLGVAAALLPADGLVAEALTEIALVVGFLALATAILNLVPVVPLDGARALRAIVAAMAGDGRRADRAVGLAGQVIGWAVVVVGLLTAIVLDALSGVLVAALGLLLRGSARTAARRRVLEDAVAGMTVGEVMEGALPFLPPTVTIDTFAERLEGPGELTALPVGGPGEVLGVVGLADIRRVGGVERATLRAVQAMTPLDDLPAVRPEDDLLAALAVLARARVDAVPVLDGGRFVGLLTRYAAGRAIGARAAAARDPAAGAAR